MAASEEAGIAIERLAASDAEALCPLSIEAGWNQIAADWRSMLTLGRGFGARGADGRWIGSALTLPLGPALAWISMVLVTKPQRGKGLGTRLLECCIAEVESSGRAAGLDATELGRPIYLPLGFRDVYPLSRWHIPRAPHRSAPVPEGVTIRAATGADLVRVQAYDGPRSGLARGAILADLWSRAPALAYVAERGDRALVGYALGRNGYRTGHVGPVVADDADVGLALLSGAVAGADQALIADVPDCHQRVRQWLQARGATAPRGFMRMVRGRSAPVTGAAPIFALAGPEFA